MSEAVFHNTRYLRPADLKRLQNMEFVARRIVDGYFSGKHRSQQRDLAQEFLDYRGYAPGDDLRLLDWKVSARTDRDYIKLFRQHTGMLCYVLLDKSNSMAYRASKDDLSKLEYASYLAAALSFLVVKQGDRTGFCLFDDDVRNYHPPGATMGHLFGILRDLEYLKPGRRTRLAQVLRKTFHLTTRRGLLIVISDFLDDPTEVFRSLGLFTHKRFEVVLFHVLHDHELHLPEVDHARFLDLETREVLVTEPEGIRRAYQQELDDYLTQMRTHARARRIDYNLVTTSTHYNEAIEKYLGVRQSLMWMR